MPEPIIQEDNSKLDAPIPAESHAERAAAASSSSEESGKNEDDFIAGAAAIFEQKAKGEGDASTSTETETETAGEEKPTVEETPTEDKPEGKPEISKPPGWEPKVAKDWKVVNDDRKRLADEVTQLKQQLDGAITGDQVKQLQAELDEHKKLLASVAAERSPEFQQAFQQQIEGALGKVKRALDGEKLEQATALLRNYDPANITAAQLNPIFEDLPYGSQALLQQALTEVEAAHQSRQKLIADSTANWDQLQLHQKQQAEQIRSSRLEEATQVLDKTWKAWTEAGIPQLQEGDAEQNQQVSNIKKLAHHIYQGELSDEDAAQAAIWASVARPILDSHLETTKQLEAAREEIKKLRGAQPSGGAPAATSHEEVEKDPIKSFEAGLNKIFEGR